MEYIKGKVHARSRRPRVLRKSQDSFEIWVKSPAERGLANHEMAEILAGELSLPAGKLRLVKGSRSPSKIIQVL